MLLKEALRVYAPGQAVIADLRLPLYDGDLEANEGLPAGVLLLAQQMRQADAIIISTPEYNKALPGVLKNALDWVSRVPGMTWQGKAVAIMSAAAGRAGGERSQFSLRHCLTGFNPHILQGPELMVAQSATAFDDDGRLSNERSLKSLEALMQALRAQVDMLAARKQA